MAASGSTSRSSVRRRLDRNVNSANAEAQTMPYAPPTTMSKPSPRIGVKKTLSRSSFAVAGLRSPTTGTRSRYSSPSEAIAFSLTTGAGAAVRHKFPMGMTRTATLPPWSNIAEDLSRLLPPHVDSERGSSEHRSARLNRGMRPVRGRLVAAFRGRPSQDVTNEALR